MSKYGWLKDGKLDPADIEAHMKANGFPYTKEEIAGLAAKTELDALVAYMQVIGTAVARKPAQASAAVAETNPLAGDAKAHELGEEVYKQNCEACHGTDGKGGIGPNLQDNVWLGQDGDISDGRIFTIISDGTDNGMPPYIGRLDNNKIWSLVSYIRHKQQ